MAGHTWDDRGRGAQRAVEVDETKQVKCAGGCRRYVTKFELMAGDTGWVRSPAGWFCTACGPEKGDAKP